ncbi:MAG: hypothetical protein QXK37_04670 [Candidatus Woesearchaeota archaeon]
MKKRKLKLICILSSIAFASFMMIISWLLISYPFLFKNMFVRFFVYSITMLLPTTITFLFAWPLGLFNVSLPAYSYYLIGYVAYATLFYFVLDSYLSRKHTTRKRYLMKVATAVGIFIVGGILFLTDMYYY